MAQHQSKPVALYYWPTPNGWKISIMLEECGLPYTVHPVNIGQGDQFKPEFLAISPNNRMPAIVDPEGPGGKPISVFESGAILQYLGRKTGKFYPADERARVAVDHGCSGRWAISARWPARRIISDCMRRSKFRTRSTATPMSAIVSTA
jgi:GST-like protein